MLDNWHDSETIQSRAKQFVELHRGSTFVQWRISKALTDPLTDVSREEFWNGVIMCLITSQQKSGPNSRVAVFLDQDPFPLALNPCLTNREEGFFSGAIKQAGLRFADRIGGFIEKNISILQNDGWAQIDELIAALLKQRQRAPISSDIEVERKAADEIDNLLWGFGPKQSRNLWQYLGLARFEIPIDSRFTAWLQNMSFPLPVDGPLLSSSSYYKVVLDSIHQLCLRIDELPCVLDAAIFASNDVDWSEHNPF